MSRTRRQLHVVRQAVRAQQWQQDEQRATLEAARAETESRRDTVRQHEQVLLAVHEAARGLQGAGQALQPALLAAAQRHAAARAADVRVAAADVETASRAEGSHQALLSETAAQRRGLERQAERLQAALEAAQHSTEYREQDEHHAARHAWQKGTDGPR